MAGENVFVWLGGDVILRHDARISCDNRGFRFGDGTFTTIAILKQTLIFWDLHKQRLQNGLDILAINADISGLHNAAQILIQKNNIINGLCRIIITRGEGSNGYLPTGNAHSTIYIETQNTPPPIANMQANVAMRLQLSEWRRPPPNCLPNTSKIMQGMNPILAKMAAVKAGYDEALMLSHDDFVSEAASSNIFWLEAGQIFTPPLQTGCLNGVMRQKMLQFGTIEKLVIINKLLECEAAFLTNCVAGIAPIASLNEQKLPQNPHLITPYINAVSDAINNEINIAKCESSC